MQILLLNSDRLGTITRPLQSPVVFLFLQFHVFIFGCYTACARLPNDRSSQRSDVGEGTRADRTDGRGGGAGPVHTLPALP